MNISNKMIFLGNGIDELLHIITLTFSNKDNCSIVCNSTFPGHYATFEAMGIKFKKVNLKNYKVSIENIIKEIDANTSIIYICNPHNPTGTAMKANEYKILLDIAKEKNIIVVFDEAYGEFADKNEFDSAMKYIYENENILVLKTFSKAYGLAGLRCGYALGGENLIRRISKYKKVLSYNINRIACVAASESLKRNDFLESVIKNNNEVKLWLYNELDKLGIEYIPSQTNFILIKLINNSKFLIEKLFLEYGIKVKDANDLGFENHIRISIGKKDDMEYLIKAINKILEV